MNPNIPNTDPSAVANQSAVNRALEFMRSRVQLTRSEVLGVACAGIALSELADGDYKMAIVPGIAAATTLVQKPLQWAAAKIKSGDYSLTETYFVTPPQGQTPTSQEDPNYFNGPGSETRY